MRTAVPVAPISPSARENGAAYGSRQRDVGGARRGGKAGLCQGPPVSFASSFRFTKTGLRYSPPQGGRWVIAAKLVARAIRRVCLAAAVIWLASAPAHAVNPDEMLKDPALEARARTLSQELRCLVCQNESIDDSNAALAGDIRVLLRERLQKGDTDRQAIDYLVARYGEFILLKPRFNAHTWALWLMPPGVLVIGGLVAAGFYWQRRKRPAAPAPLDAAEQAEVSRLMSEDGR